ncbi:SAM-dependent methyltransferase [Altererythrobacter atlanticus]|uniref:Methyltransferase domain protein n=1 Tax=Croceibacterium atlanticum TaxID=1267766 RepID=A0A0F7KLC4_9SPHN|nr:class I SAM-dependent methyltransferase [Croceibacterium atlanticum]AKH41358.1 Methyltransferase domain protein [Croceibacterium atlanticum]MBB5734127.1 SAM-dependent methyltransferase [Croceibacterium atlanticum]
MLDTSPNSTGNRFRAKRLRDFLEIAYKVADEKGRCRVIDVGGTTGYWQTWDSYVDWQKLDVVCVNLNPSHAHATFDKVTVRRGDATHLDDVETDSFDLAYSNSVIEHVGRERFSAFANEVRRVATGFFVQTPNFWFPYEPHARTPLLHWMPDAISARLLLRHRLGHWERVNTLEEAITKLRSAELLTRREFAHLFPDATIHAERFFGLTKSLIAVKRPWAL